MLTHQLTVTLQGHSHGLELDMYQQHAVVTDCASCGSEAGSPFPDLYYMQLLLL